MTESEFHRAVDEVLRARRGGGGKARRRSTSTSKAGILTIGCPDGTKVIVNRQTPNREIWVAARSGGFHFAARDGAWRDTRTRQRALRRRSRAILAAQAGERVDFG